MATDTASADERLKKVSVTGKLMKRPELGALAGLVLVTIFFAITADPVMFSLSGILNFLSPAAQLGILALGAGLLMVGGEFDHARPGPHLSTLCRGAFRQAPRRTREGRGFRAPGHVAHRRSQGLHG
jgi:hypothetical protein